jgi:hypothetical protein
MNFRALNPFRETLILRSMLVPANLLVKPLRFLKDIM